MGLCIACFSVIGILFGVIYALMMANFDDSVKKVAASLIEGGVSIGSIIVMFNLLDVIAKNERYVAIISLVISFLLSFVLSMLVVCHLIKDKYDEDILRIRDIILGKKDYIDKYYEMRKRQIDNKLNIPALEEREKNVAKREDICRVEERRIQEENDKLNRQSKKSIRIILPVGKPVIIEQRFIDEMPSYLDSYSTCIEIFKSEADKVAGKGFSDKDEMMESLYALANAVLENIFGYSTEIRVHFRYYDDKTEKYECLLAIEGKARQVNNLTPIPFNNSLIELSFKYKRAIIKHINQKSAFITPNHERWQDYMTITAYNIQHFGRPLITFGISVKSEARFRDLFYFLNYAKFDTCINECLEKMNFNKCFESIICENGINIDGSV